MTAPHHVREHGLTEELEDRPGILAVVGQRLLEEAATLIPGHRREHGAVGHALQMVVRELRGGLGELAKCVAVEGRGITHRRVLPRGRWRACARSPATSMAR